MKYLLALNGTTQGPFELDKVNEMVREGKCQSSDLAWTEGWDGWKAVSTIEGYEAPHSFANPPPISRVDTSSQNMPSAASPFQPVAPLRSNTLCPPPEDKIYELAERLSSTFGNLFAKAVQGAKRNSALTVLKTRIAKKHLELRKAHSALGRKLYKDRTFLSMQEEIEGLERLIAESNQRLGPQENETPTEMLKRKSKSAMLSVESEMLTLKLNQCLVRLGVLARQSCNHVKFNGAEIEIAYILKLDEELQKLELEAASLVAVPAESEAGKAAKKNSSGLIMVFTKCGYGLIIVILVSLGLVVLKYKKKNSVNTDKNFPVATNTIKTKKLVTKEDKDREYLNRIRDEGYKEGKAIAENLDILYIYVNPYAWDHCPLYSNGIEKTYWVDGFEAGYKDEDRYQNSLNPKRKRASYGR